jgi:MCP family monocarboxylic acid transporter-like MFS transporter 10
VLVTDTSLLKALIQILLISGLIYDHTKSYTVPFLLAGIPPIVGALILFLIRCVPDDDSRKRSPSVCLVEAPLHDASITPLQDGSGSGDDGTKLVPVANGVCSKSASPPPSYKEAVAGMWVEILSSSATTPSHIPEYRHLLAQKQLSYSFNCYLHTKQRCYSYSVL